MIQPTSFIKYYWRQMAQIIDLNKFLSDGDGWDFLIDSFWTLIWRTKKKKKLSGYVKMTHVHTFQFRYYKKLQSNIVFYSVYISKARL